MSLTTVQNGMIGTVNSLTDSSGAVYGGLYGFKNRIINGAMGIWQRGTSSTTASAGYYTADRWATYFPSGSGTVTQDSSLVPSGFQYGLRFTSGATGSACNFYQTIETKNCYDLAGQNATVSAYVAGTAGQTAILNILYSTTADAAFTSSFTIVNSVNITLTGTPTKYSVTGAIPSNAQTIQITLTPATMSSGQYVTFTGVQLEKGSTATSFDYRPYGTELQLCQRYYWKSNPENTAKCGCLNGSFNGTTTWSGFVQFPVPMRAQPTITRGGNSDNFYAPNVSGSLTGNVVGWTYSTISAFTEFNSASPSASGAGYYASYNGQLSVNAEL